jgi:hypothetical protein
LLTEIEEASYKGAAKAKKKEDVVIFSILHLVLSLAIRTVCKEFQR